MTAIIVLPYRSYPAQVVLEPMFPFIKNDLKKESKNDKEGIYAKKYRRHF